MYLYFSELTFKYQWNMYGYDTLVSTCQNNAFNYIIIGIAVELRDNGKIASLQ